MTETGVFAKIFFISFHYNEAKESFRALYVKMLHFSRRSIDLAVCSGSCGISITCMYYLLDTPSALLIVRERRVSADASITAS